MTPQGDAALYYTAELGWPIFPLHSVSNGRCSCCDPECGSPGKHPRTLNGCLDASSSAEQIGTWWDEHPDSNVGLATGSELVVIDVDGSEGEESLTQLLVALDITLPTTIVSHTGRGRHLVYSLSGAQIGCSQDLLGDSLDVRGVGGYIVAPPSVHYSGTQYRWERAHDLSPATLPPIIAEEHERRREERRNRRESLGARRWGPSFGTSARDVWERVARYTAKVPSGLADGRKRTAYVYAAALVHDFSLSEGEALEVLLAWNRDNAPPLGEGLLERTFLNAVKYGGRQGQAA